MASSTSRGQQVFTGVAAVLVLAFAFWLLLGRSPDSTRRVEVAPGTAVATDAGTITVHSLNDVPEGTPRTPARQPGRRVEAIRFTACRATAQGALVDLSLFSVLTADGQSTTAEGSKLSEETGNCIAGETYVQVPLFSPPTQVEYAADPLAVWTLPHA
jgi:hypothetical protein